MPLKYSVVKYCRTCNGKGSVKTTLNIDEKMQDMILLCPHCKGKGNHLWGYITDEDLGMPIDDYGESA
jgi:DnaJ-class molecular chaperone